MEIVVNREKTAAQPRLPDWLRRKVHHNADVLRVRKLLNEHHLHTVCQSAGCPNITECFGRSTATFMILGNICTRRCRFCGVQKGRGDALDLDEPDRVAEAVHELNLHHVVITSVTRDDLPDGGASQFARTVVAIHRVHPGATVEVLIPDFQGKQAALETVLASGVDILNHNVETVPRLYPLIRPEADFNRSIRLLEQAKTIRPAILTKTGLMAGLGETRDEMRAVFESLAEIYCDALTIGQYLQPSPAAQPVVSYIPPEVFKEYESEARVSGIPWVMSGPYVRSSYHAEELIAMRKGAVCE